MNGDKLIQLIGKPISDADVQSMFTYFGYQELEKTVYAGSLYEKEICISYLAKISFDAQYTDPPYQFSREDHVAMPFENPDLPQLEFIVEKILFTREFKGELPFGLNWNSTKEDFKKLGTPNGEATNAEKAKVYYFLNEKYRIQIYLNKNNTFEYLTVWWIHNGIKKAKKLKETIESQNKNIIPENHVAVKEYLNKKPTIKWYKDLLEDEPFYTKESIDETDAVLTVFIDNLVVATKEKKANKVLSAVEKVVLSLNKLEEKHGHIETIEREQLCPFILDAAQATGFECDYDLTEDWRDW